MSAVVSDTSAVRPAVVPGAVDVGVREQHVWFGDAARPLSGWLSAPADGRARAGVVLCPPMGEEGRSAHRTFRRLASTLAERGFLALRFDYDGTGDSAGRLDDPERVAAWLRSVAAAHDEVVAAGAPSVALVGMRLGATLAAVHADRLRSLGDSLPALVLWDPCASGRTFLREGEMLLRLSEEHAALGQPDDGLHHTPGFHYTPVTATDLRGLDLSAVAHEPLAARTLLLSRPDRPLPPRLDSALGAHAGLTRVDAADQAGLLDLPPSDCVPPARSLAAVATWLDQTLPRGAHPMSLPDRGATVHVASSGPGSDQVVETQHEFSHGIRGVVTQPLEPAPGAPWVVLVNVAIEHHIGPGRQWVEWGRRWAAAGLRVARVDLSGVGDSPTRPGRLDDEIFAPEWIDDIRGVVRELGADGAPVALVGLCSGAYTALEAALWEDVSAVLAINPRLTLYPATKGTRVHTPVRRAAQVPVWPVAAIARRHRKAGGGVWRIYRQLAAWHAPYLVLSRVVRRGTRLQVITCPDDARDFVEVALWRPALRRAVRRGRLGFERRPGLDHSLLMRSAQLLAAREADAFLGSWAHLPLGEAAAAPPDGRGS